LEHHTDRPSELDQRHIGVVDVLAENLDLAFGRDVAVALVDAVEAAEQRGLAATRGPDQRGDDAVLDGQRDALQRLKVAVPEAQILGGDALFDCDFSGCARHPKIPLTYS
jgi:hypothetical protein